MDAGDFLGQIFTELDVIAAVLHRKSNADCGLAVIVHHCFRRVCITAGDGCDIAQAEDTAVGIDGDGSNIFHAVGAAGNAQVGVGCVGLNHTAGIDRGLCFDSVGNTVDIQSQLCQLGSLHLHEDFLRLYAYQLNLFDIRHAEEVELDFFGVFTHILIGEAVTGNGVDIAVNVIKTVVIKRTYGTRRQVLLAVIDDVAQLQPALTYRVAGNLILERYGNNADAGTRIAGDFLNLRQTLNLLFQSICQMHLNILGAGTGPGCGYYHLLDGKAGVLAASERFKGKHTHNQHKHSEEVN